MLASHINSQHAEIHVSRGRLLASSGVDHSSGIEQHEDSGSVRSSSPPLSPRRPPAMRLQRDGSLRMLTPPNKPQEIYVAMFGDGVVLGFADKGARFELQRALDLATTTVYNVPALSDDWRHCFAIASSERVRCIASLTAHRLARDRFDKQRHTAPVWLVSMCICGATCVSMCVYMHVSYRRVAGVPAPCAHRSREDGVGECP